MNKNSNGKKNAVMFSVLALAAMFIGGSLAYKYIEGKKAEELSAQKQIFAPDYAPRIGAENPKVWLVEFLDPECESCRAFAPFVKSLLEKYPKDLQLIVRYAPFHQNSVFAVKILEAARKQNKYWEVLDVLFRYQPQWGDHHNPNPQAIWQYLPQAGVDVAQIRLDMEDPAIMDRIKQDMEDVKRLNVRGTPTFYVNGKPLSRFGKAALVEAIDAELK